MAAEGGIALPAPVFPSAVGTTVISASDPLRKCGAAGE
jgi:hypothetical protein